MISKARCETRIEPLEGGRFFLAMALPNLNNDVNERIRYVDFLVRDVDSHLSCRERVLPSFD